MNITLIMNIILLNFDNEGVGILKISMQQYLNYQINDSQYAKNGYSSFNKDVPVISPNEDVETNTDLMILFIFHNFFD